MKSSTFSLIRFGARDYDSRIGRWTTRDPSGFNGGTTNLYEYGFSNPMSYVDSDGLSPKDVAGIKNIFNNAVIRLTNEGKRRNGTGRLNGILNNLAITGRAFGVTSNNYLGCSGQAIEAKDDLMIRNGMSGNYDDTWTFSVVPAWHQFHFTVIGTSSNPNDPVIELDPWANSIMTRGGK